MQLNITQALIEDAEALTELAFAAKQHWGYPTRWMEAWRTEIAVTSDFLCKEHGYKALNCDKQLVGYYGLARKPSTVATANTKPTQCLTLQGFWVAPRAMGRGVGRQLFAHMLKMAKSLDARLVEWESDPNAAGFYLHMGAQIVGKKVYDLEGQSRILPIMHILLT